MERDYPLEVPRQRKPRAQAVLATRKSKEAHSLGLLGDLLAEFVCRWRCECRRNHGGVCPRLLVVWVGPELDGMGTENHLPRSFYASPLGQPTKIGWGHCLLFRSRPSPFEPVFRRCHAVVRRVWRNGTSCRTAIRLQTDSAFCIFPILSDVIANTSILTLRVRKHAAASNPNWVVFPCHLFVPFSLVYRARKVASPSISCLHDMD